MALYRWYTTKRSFMLKCIGSSAAPKLPTKFSWGGEDGLNETPLINPTAIDDLERYNGTPSWSILSFLSRYQYRKNIKLNFGVTNIFDLHYRTFASGISSEGRSFRLGLKVKI